MRELPASFLLISYRLLGSVLAPLILPSVAALMMARKKYRAQLPCRMGIVPDDVSGLAGSKPRIWLHALSVGEVNAAMPLLNAIRARWPESALVCSASTATGINALKQKALKLDAAVTCLPLDFSFLTSHVISSLRPDLFILTETDIWPDFIWRLHEQGIPPLLVNGSISSSAARRLRQLKQRGIDAAGFLYGGFETVAMQSEDDAVRLSGIGSDKIRNIRCLGNLKYDIQTQEPDPDALDQLRQEFLISPGDFVIIAGSTHPGEEALLAGCFDRLCKLSKQTRGNRLKFIVAPRDPKRARELMDIFSSKGLDVVLRSDIRGRSADVVILDTLGELSKTYALGDVAFVGGSFVSVGGHNLFEPAAHGIPVFWGPYVESCRDMAVLLETQGGGKEVQTVHELCKEFEVLLNDFHFREVMGKAAKECVSSRGGATERYVSLIENSLPYHNSR